MRRRVFALLLTLGVLCALFPAAMAEEEMASVTALCVAGSGESVFLDEKEFQLLCTQATGHDLESVSFSTLPARVGTLTCRGERVTAEDTFYMYQRPAISQVCFTPYSYSSSSRFTGQAEVAFTMTSEKEETVSGKLILYVPEEFADPAEILPGNKTRVKVGTPVELCDLLPTSAHYQVGTTFYVGGPVTSAKVSLPSSAQGSLWLDYGYPSARKLLPDETLFTDQAPNFYNLTFVPADKAEREVRLEYTISSDGKKNLPGSVTLSYVEDTKPVSPTPTPAPTPHFYDMDGWEWAAPAAEFLGDKDYGDSESSFRPGDNATRMELIHALVLAAYSPYANDPIPDFSDLPADPALVASAATAAYRGLVLGNGEGLLLPDEPITRQDALVILHRAMKNRGKVLPLYGDLSQFSDAGDVSPYAQEAAAILAARGVLLGDGAGKLEPLSPITRAEMACLLYRAFGS